MSLSDLIKRELERVAERPTMKEWLDREERRAGDTRTTRRTMIVLDASVVVELLTNGGLANSIRTELAGRDESFIVPHLGTAPQLHRL